MFRIPVWTQQVIPPVPGYPDAPPGKFPLSFCHGLYPDKTAPVNDLRHLRILGHAHLIAKPSPFCILPFRYLRAGNIGNPRLILPAPHTAGGQYIHISSVKNKFAPSDPAVIPDFIDRQRTVFSLFTFS